MKNISVFSRIVGFYEWAKEWVKIMVTKKPNLVQSKSFPLDLSYFAGKFVLIKEIEEQCVLMEQMIQKNGKLCLTGIEVYVNKKFEALTGGVEKGKKGKVVLNQQNKPSFEVYNEFSSG